MSRSRANFYLYFLTSPHRAPSWVAMMVAARGVLYMSASSPKLPLLLYWPTQFPDTTMSKTPLQNREALEKQTKIGETQIYDTASKGWVKLMFIWSHLLVKSLNAAQSIHVGKVYIT